MSYYKEYVESEAVRKAKERLQNQEAAKPGAYQSAWQSQIDDVINKIQNREDFSYDVNGDALYQQYKDRYISQGKLAMHDTMGQAAALTGGYGNSYATTAGNQAYQGYLQGLNDIVPELYALAYDRYNQETNDLYNKYSLLGDRENTDYSRYQNDLAKWTDERDYLANIYNTERSYDYGKYVDDRNYAYQQERDRVSDSQWQQSFDFEKAQYDDAVEAAAKAPVTKDLSSSDWKTMQEYLQDEEYERAYSFYMLLLEQGVSQNQLSVFDDDPGFAAWIKSQIDEEEQEKPDPIVKPNLATGGEEARGYNPSNYLDRAHNAVKKVLK